MTGSCYIVQAVLELSGDPPASAPRMLGFRHVPPTLAICSLESQRSGKYTSNAPGELAAPPAPASLDPPELNKIASDAPSHAHPAQLMGSLHFEASHPVTHEAESHCSELISKPCWGYFKCSPPLFCL